MNPNTSRFFAMHARWPMRAAICCALACSVFWAGNVDAGEYSSDLNSIILRLQDIAADVDDLRADYAQDYPELISEIKSISLQANSVVRSLSYILDAQDNATGAFRVMLAASQFQSLESSLATLDRRMRSLGVGSVTNFLGQTDFQKMVQDFEDAVIPTFFSWIESEMPRIWETWAPNSSLFFYPGESTPYIAIGTGPTAADGQLVFAEPFQNEMGLLWESFLYPSLQALFDGSSNGVATATTNILTTQNTTLERVAEYVAGVSNAVGTISNEYDTDPTGSNDLPSAEKPKELVVEKSVDTSSLEEAVQQTFDGLEGLTPTGSSSVPEIMIRDTYRGEDAIRVRLDLSEISIATRVCKACWAILLAVGILGVVRSEWDYWTTLGGSAT